MDTIEANIQRLTCSIKQSSEYREYKKIEAQLDAHPELWEKVDSFRAHNFKLQYDKDIPNMFQAMDDLNLEYEEIRKIPEVNEYLQAELDLCRLLQQISLEINGSLDIHIPNL